MSEATVFDAALEWHLRQETMDAADWLRFVEWLEADPAHAAAYDTVSLADALRHDEAAAPAPAPPPVPANDNPPAPRRRWWLGAGVAAAVVLAGVATLRPTTDGRTIVASAPQTLQLADGSAVALSSGARLVIGPGGARAVRLDGGRATFHVRHDAGHPFAVQVGGWTVQDVGTVFTVTHAGGGLDIGVREGAILLDPRGAAIPVRAGEAVSIAQGGAPPVRSALAQDGARTFRFTGESLGSVARTIGLALDIEVRTAPDAAQRPFIGVLRLTGRAAEDIPHLAAMTGTRATDDGGTWTIGTAGAATR